MNNKQIIKEIIIEEFSKCNNFNYQIEIGNLYLSVNTKKLYPSLINNSSYFEGGVESEWRFEKYKSKNFYLSYNGIWSKFEEKTKLQYTEIQSIVKDVLEEGFKLKEITPILLILANIFFSIGRKAFKLKGYFFPEIVELRESFKIKGISPRMAHWSMSAKLELMGITPRIRRPTTSANWKKVSKLRE